MSQCHSILVCKLLKKTEDVLNKEHFQLEMKQ